MPHPNKASAVQDNEPDDGVAAVMENQNVDQSAAETADEGGWEAAGIDGEAAAPDDGLPTLEQSGKQAEKIVHSIKQKRMDKEALVAEIRASEPDLIKRANALRKSNELNWPDADPRTIGGTSAYFVSNTAKNRLYAFDVLFGSDVKEGTPYFDTYSMQPRTWEGRVFDNNTSMRPILEAVDALGLKKQEFDTLRKAFEQWTLCRETNSLIDYINKHLPQWDGTPRLDASLIDAFECRDTPLTREFSRYFWMSIYMRCMHPGCQAPMTIALIGGQNAGKTYFSKLIVRALTGDETAKPVNLNYHRLMKESGKNEFLREQTGNSIIANCGEMVGFDSAALEYIKDFQTSDTDEMHFKYRGIIKKQRQWIVIMDGNKYDGLQRDATGNRRFYPVFAGQMDDENGQPRWSDKFSAWFTKSDEASAEFKAYVWQCMAECRAILSLDRADATRTYDALVNGLTPKVAAFNKLERESNRGTAANPDLDGYFHPMMERALGLAKAVKLRDKSGRTVVRIMQIDLWDSYKKVSGSVKPPPNVHLIPMIQALGGEYKDNLPGNRKGFDFSFETVADLRAALVEHGIGYADEGDAAAREQAEKVVAAADAEREEAREGF
ncbi:conserved protein of unknown function [Burkholderia multivorans]